MYTPQCPYFYLSSILAIMNKCLLVSFLVLCGSSLAAQFTVFPGDANNNGKVDQYDILAIGFAFGQVGPMRIQTDDTQPQGIAQVWDESFPDGPNFIYADANGDGLVSMLDFITWNANFGVEHDVVTPLNIPAGTPAAPARVVWNNNQLLLPLTGNQSFSLPINFVLPPDLGSNGVAFRLKYHPGHFSSVGLSLNNNWLTTDGNGISLVKGNPGHFDIGISRFGASPINGGGTGGTLNLIVIGDMVGLMPVAPDTISTWIVIEDVLLLDGAFLPIPVRADSFEIKLYRPGTIAAISPVQDALQARLFPNPSKGTFTIYTAFPFHDLTIFDALGRLVRHEQCPPRRQWTVDELVLAPGYYFVRTRGERGVSILKMLVN